PEEGLELSAASSHDVRGLPPSVGNFDGTDKFTVAVRVRTRAPTAAIVSRMMDDGEKGGWALYLADGQVHFALTNRWLDDGLRVHTRARVNQGQDADRARHLMVTYD